MADSAKDIIARLLMPRGQYTNLIARYVKIPALTKRYWNQLKAY